jgi:hypothetical protein
MDVKVDPNCDDADARFLRMYGEVVYHVLNNQKTGLDPEKCDCGAGDHYSLRDEGRPNPVAKAARDQGVLLESARAKYRCGRSTPP